MAERARSPARERGGRWGGGEGEGGAEKKVKANFGLTGTLNKDARTGKLYNGVVLKWSEPADAVTPKGPGWRLYVFDGDEPRETLHVHRQSAFLLGSDARVADVLLEHESCDEQHAVLQFRVKTVKPPPGSLDKPRRFVRPYVMDLESKAGTLLNGTRLEPGRYVELLQKDVLRFGTWGREFVVLKAKKGGTEGS